jgi:hypothetical protein
MKDLRPDSLVLEMCNDRYERWIADAVADPNYDALIGVVHRVVDKDPEKLLKLEHLDIYNSNIEYLIGFDFCSYRMPCKPVMGDRSYKVTKRRYESKI